MKRECEECLGFEEEQSKKLSKILGEDVLEEMIYGLFSPESLESTDDQGSEFDEMIEQEMRERATELPESYLQEWLGDLDYNWIYKSWITEYARRERAREEVWERILEKIRDGTMRPQELPLRQLIRNFPRKILEKLAKDGYLDLKWQRHLMHPKVYLGHAEFTPISERLIATKVLEEAFKNLEKLGYGLHELSRAGSGTYPSNLISDFDEYQHSYDNLDLQETLLTAAIRDPSGMELDSDTFMARLPLHNAKSVNIILLDISGSMYGDKFKGGVMAALALRQLLEDEFKEDLLQVVAYNDEANLVRPGDVLKLRPHGQTDIGRALDLCTQILSREEGNKNVFMITDSEPTVSCNRDLSPVENMFRAAYASAEADIRLSVIMLDRNPGLRSICESMARINGYSNVVYVENPLNLKEFIVRTFIDERRRMPT